jgi:RNA polymerase sigma-70 factor (sigma-E family)
VDASAVEALVHAHARSWFGTAYLLCGDAHAAEDLVQDTLVHLLPRWASVLAADRPASYVRQALVHRFIDGKRRASRTVVVEDVPDWADAADMSDRVVNAQSVRSLLASLPERPRAALVLKYLCDWSDVEIARAIGCRVATVRSMTRRALLQLRSTDQAQLSQSRANFDMALHDAEEVER